LKSESGLGMHKRAWRLRLTTSFPTRATLRAPHNSDHADPIRILGFKKETSIHHHTVIVVAMAKNNATKGDHDGESTSFGSARSGMQTAIDHRSSIIDVCTYRYWQRR
jgi:hypothetical protein